MSKKLALLSIIFLCIAFLALQIEAVNADWLDFFFQSKDSVTVKGNKVLYNGKEVKLHGVAMGNPYLRRQKDHREENDYSIVKSWNANVIRLSVHPGVYKKNERELKRALKAEVQAARSQGLIVIVDWHVIGFPNGSYMEWPNGEYRGIYYESKMTTAEDFWIYMATEFRSDRGVIFEIWNEPVDYNNSKAAWKDLRPYLERLQQVIRSRGAQNTILASSLFWSYDMRGVRQNPLRGENIGYTWHVYPNKDGYLTWDKALDGLPKEKPIFVTEWGYSTETKGDHYSLSKAKAYFPEKLKKYIVDNELHSTAWIWHANWEPSMLQDDWQTPTTFGRFVKTFLGDMQSGKLIAESKKAKIPNTKTTSVKVTNTKVTNMKTTANTSATAGKQDKKQVTSTKITSPWQRLPSWLRFGF